MLQQREEERTARCRLSGGLPVGAPTSPDPGTELLPVARGFKADYDRWADALDRCTSALRRADTSDPTRDRHGLRVLEHRMAHAAGSVLAPFEQAVLHPTPQRLPRATGL